MSYVTTKPDSGKSPDLDAPTIQGNFAAYAGIFGTNHVPINSALQGDHSNVIFENQSADPGVTNDYTVLYSKNAAAKTGGPQPQLFVQIPQFLPNAQDTRNAPNIGMQLTYNTVNTAGPQYQSFLVGGYILYFGVDSGTTSGSGSTSNPIQDTITLVPAPTKILLAIAEPQTMTAVGTPTPLNVGTQILGSTNQFKIFSNPGKGLVPGSAYSFGWLAIGRA
jgi:hypothetical protein